MGLSGGAPTGRIAIGLAVIIVVAMTSTGGLAMRQPASPEAKGLATPHASPAAATPSARDQGSHTVITTGKVALEITDRSISPRHFEVAAGRNLTLTISNSGRKPHRFAVEKLDVSVVVKPGATETVQIATPRLGDYVCMPWMGPPEKTHR